MRRLLIALGLVAPLLALAACSSSLQKGGGALPQAVSSDKTIVGVDKTAEGGFTPGWSLTKEAFDIDGNPLSSATIPSGGSATFHYVVKATPSGVAGSYTVQGTITVRSQVVAAVDIVAITDTLDNGDTADVTCPQALPITLAAMGQAGDSVVCSYAYSYPADWEPTAGATYTNDVSVDVTWNDGAGGATVSNSATFSFTAGSAPAPTFEDVPTLSSAFGWSKQNVTTTADGTSWVYSYDLVVTNESATCGEHYTLENLASIVGTDTTASYSIDLYSGDCTDLGCASTIGYWKTHTDDPTWFAGATIDGVSVGGPDAPFFSTGYSWLEIFNLKTKGSAYLQVARQYMATLLNLASGAYEPDDVSAALSAITAWLQSNEPYDYTGGDPTNWADMLNDFNTGADGVPHCGS